MEKSERDRIKKQIDENKHMRTFLFRLAGVDREMIRVSGAPISNEKLRDLAFSRYFGFLTDKKLKFRFTPIKIGKYFKDLKIVKIWNNLDSIIATANIALKTAEEAKNRAISLRYPPDELVTAIASRLSIHDSKIVSRTFIEQIQKKSKERRGEEQKRWDEHDGITGDEEYTTHLRAVPEYWKEEGHEFPCFFRGLDEEKETPKFINVAPTVHDGDSDHDLGTSELMEALPSNIAPLSVPSEDDMASKGINSDKFRGVEDVDKDE
jgi:hypothetical protein